MIFSAPVFLYLLPLAGLPVLFHFLLRQKKRQILFPTLMFFYRTDPRLNARRNIHQILLLLMRVLLISLVLMALSRPKFQSALPMGGKISVVAVVDNSGSMSDHASADKTKLDVALEGAKRLVSSLADSARMNVVTLVQDRTPVFGDVPTSDKKSLLSLLDEIKPTSATGSASRAMAGAIRLLEADSKAGGVIHVFSDLQESEWADEALRSEAADASIRVYLHRIKSEPRREANVAISSVQLPRQKILPRHPVKAGVVCRNNSDAVATIQVNSIDDQDNKSTEQVVLEPGRTKMVEVEMRPAVSGYHWLRTWIEGDGFSADNEAGIGIVCRPTAGVLFAGSPDEFGVLPTALSPDESGQVTGMVSRFGRLSEISQAGAEKPILVVATWQEMGQLQQNSSTLRQYIEGGGNLLIVPSPKPAAAAGEPAGWLGAGMKARAFHPRGIKMEVMEKDNDFWNRIRAVTGAAALQDESVFAFYPLVLSEGFVPLLGVDFDKVILAQRELGKGNVYVSGTAFDPQWNTLPMTGFVVVMAQSIAVAGASLEQDAMISLAAGEQAQGIDAGAQQLDIVSLSGDATEWKQQGGEAPVFSRPGVYLVKAGEKEYCICVRSSEKEGLTQFLGGSRVPALERITHTVVDYDPTDNFQKYNYGQIRTFGLFLPLLLLATLAMLAEGWLANPVRAKSEQTTQPEGKRDIAHGQEAGGAAGRPNREMLVGRGAG